MTPRKAKRVRFARFPRTGARAVQSFILRDAGDDGASARAFHRRRIIRSINTIDIIIVACSVY